MYLSAIRRNIKIPGPDKLNQSREIWQFIMRLTTQSGIVPVTPALARSWLFRLEELLLRRNWGRPLLYFWRSWHGMGRESHKPRRSNQFCQCSNKRTHILYNSFTSDKYDFLKFTLHVFIYVITVYRKAFWRREVRVRGLSWPGPGSAVSRPQPPLLTPLSALSALAAPPPAPAQTRSLSPDPAPVKDFPINCAQRSRR